jgi:nondiscriminating glutamyl-tRNA synthetase
MSDVRVRFAPSPTGELHVGGLRTALFNYLFARHHGGRFLLRIEDTDRERWVAEAEAGIVDMLAWAGLTPDEGPHLGGDRGPYRQSERLHLYREAAERLLAQGHAYQCYVTPEELEQMRAAQVAAGEFPRYDGRHRNLGAEERARFEAEGRRPVVRMRIPEPEEEVVVDDLVRGRVAFGSGQLDDQVLLKSDGFPTYHLAVVVDDHLMGITHVLRAEEWLPSTPKHLYLFRWLGWEPPRFAHLPLLLNEDRSKMSKRSGDTAAEDYRAKGYLPEALVNFLALLGWSPGDDQELFTLDELVERFSLERVTKAGAVFDLPKLDWMNQVYIGRMDSDALYDALRPFIDRTPYAGEDDGLLRRIGRIVQPYLVTLAGIRAHLELFFRPDDGALSPAARDGLAGEEARRVVAVFRERLLAVDDLDEEEFRHLMKEVQRETQVKGKGLWGPLRCAITLEAEGPDLAQVAAVFGRKRTLARLDRVLTS